MNVKFYLCLIYSIIGVRLASQAQVSYNKQAMGVVGDVPKPSTFASDYNLEEVDMATGTLKISIPLYEIKVNDIVVPISMHYTALGLKVGQEAGPIGMGWELRAGGKIVTNISGKPDNWTGDTNDDKWSSDVLQDQSNFNWWTNGSQMTFVKGVVDGDYDATWDTYSYTLPGKSGMFTKNGMTYPYDPFLNIEFHNFKMTSTNGVVYKFESGEQFQRKKRTFYEPTGPFYQYLGDSNFFRDPKTVNWHNYDLRSIFSTRFKDSVTFSYEHLSSSDPRLSAKTKILTSESIPFHRVVNPANADGGGIEHWNYRLYEIGSPILSQTKNETLVHTRLQNIKFPYGQVSFEYRQNDILGRDVLLNITVYQIRHGVTTILKKYEFEYDLNQTAYGHYLTKLHQYDSKGANQGDWHFYYLDKLPVPPNTNSMAQDRWGFYNGKTTNKTLLEHPDKVMALRTHRHYPIQRIRTNVNDKMFGFNNNRPELLDFYNPTISLPEDGQMLHRVDFADRDFNPNVAYKGMISGIKTPMGSSYSYAYEPHRFRFTDFQPGTSYVIQQDGGGYRVKSITRSLDHPSMYLYTSGETSTKRVFTYGEATYAESESIKEENGVGTVTIPGNVLGTEALYYDYFFNSGDFESTTIFRNLMLLSHPVNDMVQRSGSYGIYKSATEKIENVVTSQTFGKTVQYNHVPEYDEAIDVFWRNTTTVTNPADFYIQANYMNPGVKKEKLTEPYAIKKYKYGQYSYLLSEETLFKYISMPAPASRYPKLLSCYIGVAGQFSGKLPPGVNQNTPLNDPVEVAADQNFYLTIKTPPGKALDYISETRMLQEADMIVYPTKYSTIFKNMAEFSDCIKLESRQTKTYSQGIAVQDNTVKYFYENPVHMLPNRTATISSMGDSTFVRKKYADDYITGGGIVSTMKSQRLGLNEPLEEFVTYKRGINEYIKSGHLNIFTTENNAVVPHKTYKVKLGSDTRPFAWEWYNGNNIDLQQLDEQSWWDLYTKGNVHKFSESKGTSNVVLWGYKGQYPVAKVTNANNVSSTNNSGGKFTSADVAYTSFEDVDSCNWAYAGQPLVDTSSVSGRRVYQLSSGSISKINTTPSGTYVLSYWYKDGASVSVTGGTVGAASIRNTWRNWRLAERIVSGISGPITISGSGFIDELRFHPIESQMTTYTYEPLIGLSGVIDAKGQMTYYEYDDFQRLKNVRDQRGNILKTHQYILGTSSYHSY